MLVLSRKVDESILIDGRVRITVVEIRGNQIRLGIEAPREVPIWRSEVIKSEAKSAAASPLLERSLESLALAD